jgi:hypothetical protein
MKVLCIKHNPKWCNPGCPCPVVGNEYTVVETLKCKGIIAFELAEIPPSWNPVERLFGSWVWGADCFSSLNSGIDELQLVNEDYLTKDVTV